MPNIICGCQFFRSFFLEVVIELCRPFTCIVKFRLMERWSLGSFLFVVSALKIKNINL